MTTATPLKQLDTQSFLHPFTSLPDHLEQGPVVMDNASGVYITDTEGKEYIDAMAGLWCVNIGWGQQEVVDAIAEQAGKMAYYHSFASMGNEPAIRLADRVLKLVPDNMSKIFFGNSGSDANDTNVKLVWYYNNLQGRPEKKKIISRKRAYHGVTVAAASLTGLEPVHQAFDLPLPMVLHTECPHYYFNAEPGMTEREFSLQMAAELEQMILREGPDTVAAFIAEPVMGAGGVILPPEGYFEAVQAVLRKYDILMIADEVICGFGRTGDWFGSQVFDIQPDIMTIAKGLTSGYIPMSGSIVSDQIWETLLAGSEKLGAFAHGYTYSGHPIAAAAGLANLDIMEREDLPGRAASVGSYFQEKLRSTFSEHPLVGEVRGIALVAAIELVRNRATKEPFDLGLNVAPRLANHCKQEGLICRALTTSNAISFSPPLVISEAECDELIARFNRALGKLLDELIGERNWSR